jgi:hypothetical protein
MNEFEKILVEEMQREDDISLLFYEDTELIDFVMKEDSILDMDLKGDD